MINLEKQRRTVMTVLLVFLVAGILLSSSYLYIANRLYTSAPFQNPKPDKTASSGGLQQQQTPAATSTTPAATTTTTSRAIPTPTTQIQDPQPSVRFLVNFGDSFSRTGFHYEKTGPGSDDNPRPANPVGNPKWPGWTSSGGINWVGYMVSEFNSTAALAYNFARSGSTVDRDLVDPRPTHAASFAEQVEHFNASIGHKPAYAAWTPDNSVIGIWFGVNDVRRTYATEDAAALFPRVVKQLFKQAQVLYNVGFRHFVVLDVPPLNLVPFYQNISASDDYPKLLYAIDTFNRHLRHGFERFTESNTDAATAMIETSAIFWEAYLHPASIGAVNGTCVHPRNGRCVWSDVLHPGKQVHRKIAKEFAEVAQIWTQTPGSE